jgi:hypothetical protein
VLPVLTHTHTTALLLLQQVISKKAAADEGQEEPLVREKAILKSLQKPSPFVPTILHCMQVLLLLLLL